MSLAPGLRRFATSSGIADRDPVNTCRSRSQPSGFASAIKVRSSAGEPNDPSALISGSGRLIIDDLLL